MAEKEKNKVSRKKKAGNEKSDVRRDRNTQRDWSVWRVAAEYAVGIAVLIAAVMTAWFLPDWYTRWQDERLLEQASFSARESIQFLDKDSLELADRMKLLKEAESLSYDFSSFATEWPGNYAGQNLHKKCRRLVRRWTENGLLLGNYADWIVEPYTLLITHSYAMADQTAIQVDMLIYLDEMGNSMTVVMDADLDLLYYVSVAGTMAYENMSHMMGYPSYGELLMAMERGDAINAEPDTSEMDFAAVCGAKSAQIAADQGMLECYASLEFETFSGVAQRRVICNGLGFGYAVIYGNPAWSSFVSELFAQYGDYEYLSDTKSWLADEDPYRESYEMMYGMDAAYSEEGK